MSTYRGRFAPSPTGPLHFGSLVAALGSWLDARSQQGEWLLRMEDLDRPREMPGAAGAILATLEACGLEWDGSILYQSTRDEVYAAALAQLARNEQVFPCACTRKEVADSVLRPDGESVYPGTCRNGLPPGRAARAWRLRVKDAVIAVDDAIQGRLVQDLEIEIGDFVAKRADGLFAYQLAVVVDDADQGITDIVRGADLLDSTPRQIYLQRLLGLHTPRYAHLPVAVNAHGEKLSKQTLAAAVNASELANAMTMALRFLGQQPPAGLARATPRDVLGWGMAHWRLAGVPCVRAQGAPDISSTQNRTAQP